MLRDDMQRAYRIDIETNSTIEADATEDKQLIMEVMTAMGQVLNGVGPLVAKGVLPFEAAQVMLLTVVRRFRFGVEMEDTIKAMQPPKPEDEGGAEQVKQAQEMASKELEMQKKQAEGDIKMKQMDAEMALKQKDMDLQMREMQLKVDQEMMKMEQQRGQEQLAMRDQVHQVKTGADEKVRSAKDQLSKKEAQVAQSADSKLTSGVTSMAKTTQQVQALSQSLASIQQQASQTQELLGELLKVAKAPRIKKAIRGKDNRIERVEESVAV
jgi:hypothetical protein